MAKHVIILGAGASVTSGYPLAAKPNNPRHSSLLEILSSEEHFGKYLEAKLGDFDFKKDLKEKLLKQFASFQRTDAGVMFQKGNYETADQFCFDLRRDEGLRMLTRNLKWFTALVFALHNPKQPHQEPNAQPGNQTADSDYVAFVQRLFNKNSPRLPKDIVVLTYNYDPYLEFILSETFKARNKTDRIPTALLSGFGDRDARGVLSGKGFCLLKLHGTSVLPFLDSRPNVSFGRMDSVFTFSNVFRNRQTELPSALQQFNSTYHRPPAIYFPWELITDNGNFRRKLRDSEDAAIHQEIGRKNNEVTNITLFKAIWERARREITVAEKISFVGFSAHKFMESGLRFLLKQRAKRIQNGNDSQLKVVMANPDKIQVYRLEKLLKKACLNLKFGDIACRDSFAEFIKYEM